MTMEGGELFGEKVVVKLYDAQGKEIGMTIGGTKEIAYAMSQSKRIAKAICYSEMFGEETVLRSGIESQLDKYKDKHKLGEHLLFWVGVPLVVNNVKIERK